MKRFKQPMIDIAANRLARQKKVTNIYLDTKDLICLAEKRTKQYSDEFINFLINNTAILIYSMHNIMECSAPHVVGGTESTAMKTLKLLEDIPHQYIAEAKIPFLELKEAASAFNENRKYKPIDIPFVARFDYAVSPFHEPSTANYIEYSLPKIIYDLANVDKSLFEGYGVNAQRVRGNLRIDRELPNYKNHINNFSNTLRKDLQSYGISFPCEKIDDLAEWIYQDINRCPSYRLGYEVYHKLLRNIGDAGENSDIPDFAHISCIPYVNIITLDRRMRGYVEQVDNSIGSNYCLKVKKSLDEVKRAL